MYKGLTPKVDLTDRTMIFTHIPKTGGTTLEFILRDISAMQQSIKLQAKGTIYGQFQGYNKQDTIKVFERWPDEALLHARYLTGHLPFGPHRRLQRPSCYVTILREPVARLLSQFRFGVRRGGWSEDTSMAMLFRKGLLIENLQTRQLAGLLDAKAPCTDETLGRAIDNLRSSYAVVGITDRFDEMLRLLITLFGWPDIVYGNRQVTKGSPSADLRNRAIEATRRYFAFDLDLYTQAVEVATRNLAALFEGSPTGMRRQDRVLVCFPSEMEAGKDKPILMSKDEFDGEYSAMLRAKGMEIRFV